jgi:hypothetical protein
MRFGPLAAAPVEVASAFPAIVWARYKTVAPSKKLMTRPIKYFFITRLHFQII